MVTRRPHNILKIRQRSVWLALCLCLLACNRTPATPAPNTVPPTVLTVTSAPTASGVPAANAEAATPVTSATPGFEAILPTPTATSSPGIASGSVTQGAIFTSPRYSYTVVLPCCWLALPTPGTAVESALAELEAESELPLWGDLGERVRERESGAVLELIALLPDAENLTLPVAQVTVSVLPAYGLTLDDYLSATEAELSSIANTSVQTAHIDPALGVGNFPASIIEYTAERSAGGQAGGDAPIAGLQVAFFGHDAETLIVLTFTTTIDRFADLQPEFLHIVRTVTLNGAVT